MKKLDTASRKSGVLRKITFHLYADGVHQQTHISKLYKHNKITGDKVVDPYMSCKNIKDIKENVLYYHKKELNSFFEEGFSFVLVSVNKRRLGTFQQILPTDLLNSVRFITDNN